MTSILFVIEGSAYGGGERGFAEIISRLDSSVYRIYAACVPTGLFAGGIKDFAEIIPFYFRRGLFASEISALARAIRQHGIDLVHSQGARADFFARLAGKRSGVPVISTVQMPVEGFDVNPLKKAAYVFADRFTEGCVDKFIVCSDTLLERLRCSHHIPASRMVRIYNGTEILRELPQASGSLRKELNLPDGVILIGAIGRLVWQKGFPYFLEAAAELVYGYKMTGLRFLICGEGPQKKNIERRLARLKIENHVILAGFRAGIRQVLAELDIFVLPSLSEGHPVALLEAMAMGKPIVATALGGVKETVSGGHDGLLVKPADGSALAAGICRLVGDRSLASGLGKNARETAARRFDIADNVRQHCKVYASLTQGK